MIAHFRRIIRICLGVLLITLGIVGLVLPGLQGIAMIAAGILLLAPDSRIGRWIKRMLRKLTAWVGRKVRHWRWGPLGKLRTFFKRIAAKLPRKKSGAK